MNLILGLILATIISWLNFVIVDTFLGLPEAPGVKGAETVGYSIKNRKGDLAGGFFQGNILCSPDASAGTLIASIGVYILGIQGGLIAALLVYIGNRLCADPGYAGTTGALTMTLLIFIFSFIGIHILIHWNHSRDVHLWNGNCNIHYSRNSPSYKFKIDWKNSKILWQIY